MTIYVVDPTNGNNANDGLDFHGFNLSGATFTNATKTLSSTGAFTSYTFNAGDRIAITGGTGVTTGYYEIASRTSNDAIVLVADIGGTNPTDVSSSDGPWATTANALSSVATSDTVYLAATASETITASLTFTTAAGSNTGISFHGRDGTNASTDTAYTIASGVGLGANPLVSDGGASDHYQFQYITLDATAAGTACYQQTVDTTNGLQWIKCKFIGGTSGNYWARNEDHWLIDCDLEDSGSHGWRSDANRAQLKMVGCRIKNAGDCGLRIRASKHGFVTQTVIWDSTNQGILLDSGRLNWSFISNTIDGSGADGLDLGSSTGDRMIVVGNSFTNNGGYGIEHADHVSNAYAYNHFYNNTSGPTSYSTVNTDDFADPPGIGNTSGDPLYVNAATGDFTPDTGSPLILAAYSGQANIGAVGHATGGGGGGGGIKLVGFGGGLVG